MTTPHHRTKQSGISLIESLVAIVVMALGILGILGVQMRTLSDTQNGVHRAQAIRLIENFSERIQTNPNGLGALDSYLSPWGAASAATCATGGCDSTQIATYDVYQFKNSISTNLPLGNARIFLAEVDTAAGNRRQLGIMVGWRENERAREGDSAADTNAYKAAFTPASTSSSAATNVNCPAGLTCHLQYIQPNQRCVPFTMGGAGPAAPLYCPN